MKKALKRTGIVLLALIVVMVGYSLLGLQQALKLQIGTADLTKIADGTYAGAYNSYRWTTKVEVTVKNHAITAVTPVEIQQGRDATAAELTGRILTEQRADVDAVSGATASSNSFLKAVETALTAAEPTVP